MAIRTKPFVRDRSSVADRRTMARSRVQRVDTVFATPFRRQNEKWWSDWQ